MKTTLQILTETAARSARRAQLDLQIAIGFAAEEDSPILTYLVALSEPAGESVKTLDKLVTRLEQAPEATLAPISVS